MVLQQLYSYVRRAVDDYQMIGHGDKIALGISGGKDSLTLLYALAGLRSFYPQPFELTAVTVDLGLPETDWKPVQELCRQLRVEYHVIPTQIARIVFEEHREASPCSLCSRLRKGALNGYIQELGCRKVAYAHHMDDVIETMFLSMIYEGRFYSFSPVTELTGTNLTVIRPMIYVPEVNVKGFQNKYRLPVVKSACPADGSTRREYAKELVRSINRENPGAKKQMFHAIVNGRIEGWPSPKQRKGRTDERHEAE